jgi:hypothetical protein
MQRILNKIFTVAIWLLGISLQSLCSQTYQKRIDFSEYDTTDVATVFELSEVVVKSTRNKYSPKNNPAVDIIRQVIKHKNSNRLENKDQYQVEVYEKTVLSMDEFSLDADANFIVRQFPFLENYIDTSAFSKKPILNVSLREKLYKKIYRKEPYSLQKQIIAKRHIGLDQPYDENETLTSNLNEILKGIDIFDDDINILLNRIVSPLSSALAVYYYQYSIIDTVIIEGSKYVNISYVPASRHSYGFIGELQIALDGTYSISHTVLTVSKNINLNWVDNIKIEQVFQNLPEGTQLLDSENIYAVFRPHKGAMPLQAHLSNSFRNYNFEPDTITDKDSLLFAKNTEWEKRRHSQLPEYEQRIDSMITYMKTNRKYRFINKTFEILTSGYIPAQFEKSKSIFDFGPVSSTYSSNTLEGSRFKLGGMTTARLHPKLFANGYAAYGLKDRKLKYQGQIIYSFKPRNVHPQERPIHNLNATLRYDIFVPGGNSPFNDGDNVFNSLTTGIRETQMQYVRKVEIRYEKEFANTVSFNLWLKHEKICAAAKLHYFKYLNDSSFDEISGYKTSAAGIQIRYAPGEKPYGGREGKNSVFNLSKDAPIFTLAHQNSFKNVFGSDYAYNYTELQAEKRLWLSSFGHIDMIGKVGKIWDKAPFPLLYFPLTNQSLFIQSETFTMMRAMEFIADNYAILHATYYLKGWILNRIPLINRLKLREVVSFNAIYGSLSDKNNPSVSCFNLFQLPADTRLFDNQPYMEVSVGLENIFKVMRIDYFRRLNYRDSPNIKKNGFRLAFRFSF